MPPKEGSEASSLWTSKTLKTVKEAQSQSEYLTRRIILYKSSSPESIIKAVKLNTKAILAVIHKVVLLRDQV
jgi:hypothetical protein